MYPLVRLGAPGPDSRPENKELPNITTSYIRFKRWETHIPGLTRIGLRQKHTIAVAEEAIFSLDGMAISGQDRLASGEGRDQHEQAGLGQMEVGEQGVYKTKLKAGGDEDLCFAGVLLQRAAHRLLCTMLQSANDRGADGDDAAAFGSSAVDSVGGSGGERVTLAMQADFIDSLHAQRGEGSEANVQGEASNFNSAVGECIENLRGEVQAGGGRCDRATFARVDGLVAFAVRHLVIAANVGWKRGVADAVEDGVEIIDGIEAEKALAEVVAFEDFGLERDRAVRRWKNELLTYAYFFTRMDEGSPEVFA